MKLKQKQVSCSRLPRKVIELMKLSKPAQWLWLLFKIGELALAGFQNRRNGSGRLSKALGGATRNLLSNRRRGFELDGF
jgi:hypothetical protein